MISFIFLYLTGQSDTGWERKGREERGGKKEVGSKSQSVFCQTSVVENFASNLKSIQQQSFEDLKIAI